MRRNLAPGCISSDVNLCQRKPLFPFFRGPLFLGPLFFFFFFLFFLSPAKVGSLEMQPGAKLQAYLGVIILQPHACAQRFRLRILRRTRSNAGRTSAGSLSGRIESIWKTPSKERGTPLQLRLAAILHALADHVTSKVHVSRHARNVLPFQQNEQAVPPDPMLCG